MENLMREMDMAMEFIRSTWIAIIDNNEFMPPGAPTLKFDGPERRQAYASSIKFGEQIDMPEIGFFRRTVIATDRVADATEQGQPAWDMKPGLLRGPKARVSKKGIKFNIIPFRHGGPTKSGVNANFKPMPQDIYQAAKALKPTISGEHIGRKFIYGGKLKGTEVAYPPQTKMFLAPHGNSLKVAHYTHKSGIYENMIKVQATYNKATQNKYMTFRVVSENSDPFSWWHPGRPAQPHVQWISDYCRPIIEKNLAKAAERDLVPVRSVGMSVILT